MALSLPEEILLLILKSNLKIEKERLDVAQGNWHVQGLVLHKYTIQRSIDEMVRQIAELEQKEKT